MVKPLAKFRTQDFKGYALQYSPYFENRLAVGSAANFGIVGLGRLYVLRLNPTANPNSPLQIVCEKTFDTQDGIFDVVWSESHENQLVTCSGDGSIKLWDTTLNDFPIRNWTEHNKEVFSIGWNLIDKTHFVSSSWDGTIKLWNPELAQSLNTLTGHTGCIYNAQFSPHEPNIIASCAGDQTIRIWDLRTRQTGPHGNCVAIIHGHDGEILSLDWNKYHQKTLVTGSVDCTIKSWDLRMAGMNASTNRQAEIFRLQGHQFAVRKVRCSPLSGNIILSSSYDMTMRVWNTDPAFMKNNNSGLAYVDDSHSEFVFGLDVNMFAMGQVATCAWDEGVHISHVPAILQRS